jgi:hypothetical protein
MGKEINVQRAPRPVPPSCETSDGFSYMQRLSFMYCTMYAHVRKLIKSQHSNKVI